jgi:hypothetical protein
MHFQHLSKIERGNRNATQEQAMALARYYDLDPHVIEARRMADDFWRGNRDNPLAWDAIGILQEDAAIYRANGGNL